jgi:hypothetical protein
MRIITLNVELEHATADGAGIEDMPEAEAMLGAILQAGYRIRKVTRRTTQDETVDLTPQQPES